MSESVILFVVGILTSVIGALILLLLGIIVWEIRHIRAAIGECVTDRMCKAMMADPHGRIEKLEQRVLLDK